MLYTRKGRINHYSRSDLVLIIMCMKTAFFDLKARQEWMEAHGVKPFRVKQIEHEIFRNSVIDFHEMT